MKCFFAYFLFYSCIISASADTFPSLKVGSKAPQNIKQLWQNFDPRAEPLDVEVLSEWEEEGAVIKIVRYRVGIFKGQKAMVAGVFGYPKGGKNLPALVNVHGGGQYADANAIISNAQRGYATISVSWAGRISSSKYRVNPDKVQLFWANKTDDPNYLLTTDWGAVDGYHAPCRSSKSVSAKLNPHELTLDEIDSPRNSLWFLATLAARRGITFLEEQSNVNPDKIGIYGHSMGGKITVLTAAVDKRLKVAVPTCGGISNNENESELYNATLGDRVNLSEITCPVFFLSPANDFHGECYDLPEAISLIQSKESGISSAPHHNHQDSGPFIIPGFKFLDRHLKGAAEVPTRPETILSLRSVGGIPSMSVKADDSQKIKSVDIFYTQQGIPSRVKSDDGNPKYKFWHHAATQKNGDVWSGDLPLYDTKRSLWVYANVTYQLDKPESATNYYYRPFTTSTMKISSLLQIISGKELQRAKVKSVLRESLLIEDFLDDWEKEWFTYDLSKWAIRTNKLNHPIWQAPKMAKLSLEMKVADRNVFVVRIDDHATEIEVNGSSKLETFAFQPSDFRNASGDELKNWSGIQQMELAPAISISQRFNDNGITKTERLNLGSQNWKGLAPDFKRLSWVVVE